MYLRRVWDFDSWQGKFALRSTVFLMIGSFVGGAGYYVLRVLGGTPEWAQWCGLGIWLAGVAVSAVWTLVEWGVTRARPCQHGTRGARRDPTRCAACVREAALRDEAAKAETARREEQARAEAAARSRQEQLRRQAEYDDYRKRIRLSWYLAQMDPRDFELTVCDVYRRLGYDVKATPYGGDSGVDGYLRRDGKLLILQCKRVQGAVSQPAVRDLFGTIVHEKADGGIMVTTGNVSQQAKRWLSGKPIEIVEMNALSKLIRDTFSETEIVPADWQPPSPDLGGTLLFPDR